ncbi:hypothetical protein S40288_06474 [Stachybotrys chartarum IBT 40288]|nr:hypothetical protein S40288_06474 [Stachybotrys chartarum IBT 40288]
MVDRNHRWTTVGNAFSTRPLGRLWEAEQEIKDCETIASWEDDAQWPSIDKPLLSSADAKRFDARLVKLDDLGHGAFGHVDKVALGSVLLARKRITRRRGFTFDDLRQEGLTMRKLNHRHVVRLVATYAPRAHELCLLIWPAAVCNLSVLLEDVEALRLGEGDRTDILDRFAALDITDLTAIEPATQDQRLDVPGTCPLEVLRSVVGCVARALSYCHANQVRHLDIKPSNILLKPGSVYLADFGISRDVSGQDQTTTDSVPGTERWRAPELYGDNGSSMQLSDIYSLGLVLLNVATVLYKGRLSEFEDALSYSSRLSRTEQLKIREDKLQRFVDNLTAYALVTPPFMFTYEGQETVRPRPLLSLISRTLAANPRSRPSADRIDEKLSILGGIHQIYHGECCKRPISWVEDKWDRKFAGLLATQHENERLRKRVQELEGKDKTYEVRVEKARRSRDDEVAALQARLKEAEDKVRRLEQEQTVHRKSTGRQPAAFSRAKQDNAGPCAGVGLGSTKTRSSPSTPAGRPPLQASSRSARRFTSETNITGAAQNASTANYFPNGTNARLREDFPESRAKTLSNMVGYALRSRGSKSMLPVPKTPSRTGTPTLNRDQSFTDSSMASSIFSRHSVETVSTPQENSPALHGTGKAADDECDPQWGSLPCSPSAARRRPSTTAATAIPVGPGSSLASRSPLSVSSLRPQRSDLSGEEVLGQETTLLPPVPSMPKSMSWAEVVSRERGHRQASIGDKLVKVGVQ